MLLCLDHRERRWGRNEDFFVFTPEIPDAVPELCEIQTCEKMPLTSVDMENASAVPF